VAQIGARWGTARWIAIVGTWVLLTVSCFEVQTADAASLFALLILHYVLAGLWIWLPGQAEEKPGTPTLLWFVVSLTTTSLAWLLWKELRWTAEWFAAPVILFAALNLAIVKPLRERLGSRQADLGLLVLAAGHLALAVPVALAWHWVGPVWGLFALFLAWAVGEAEARAEWDESEVKALVWMALGMAMVATLRWVTHGVDVWGFGYGYGRAALTAFPKSRFPRALPPALARAAMGPGGGMPMMGSVKSFYSSDPTGSEVEIAIQPGSARFAGGQMVMPPTGDGELGGWKHTGPVAADEHAASCVQW